MHSSISDRLPGVNATVKMARLIDRMDREFKSYLTYDEHPLCPTGPTVNVGSDGLEGGVFYGVYPGNAEFACDVRTLPGMTEEMMKADIGRFLADATADDPELRAELRWHLMVPAVEIEADHPVVAALVEAATKVLGSEPTLDAFPGATDAPYFQLTAKIPTVAAFGPGMLPRAHSPNEYMDADGAAVSAKHLRPGRAALPRRGRRQSAHDHLRPRWTMGVAHDHRDRRVVRPLSPHLRVGGVRRPV